MADSLYLEHGKSLRADSGQWYRVIQVLGVGGTAVTFLVTSTSGPAKGILFALKIFRRLSKPERRDSFLREIAFLKQNDHPAILRVFDEGLFHYYSEGRKNQYPFVVTEYLPLTLQHLIRNNNSSVVERLSFAVQQLSALVFLEKLNPAVVHRDIKPQNIFVKGKSCVLGDFGLMKMLSDTNDPDREFLKESYGPGMPFWHRTPDLVAYAKNESDLTTKSDVFQLGLVLAELFTGRNPMKRPANDDLLSPVEIESLGQCPGQFSGGIATNINRMLDANAEARPFASELFDNWMGLFQTVCENTYELEGRAF